MLWRNTHRYVLELVSIELRIAQCLQYVSLGVLVDRFHVSVAILVSTFGQVIAILVCWGLTSSQPTLYVFALLWGLFGGGFSASWSGYAGAMKRGNPNGHADIGLVVALMAAGRGVGAVITGPLSEKLLEVGWEGRTNFAYGSAYGVLVSSLALNPCPETFT